MVGLDGYFKVKPQYFESNRLLVPFKMEAWNESLKKKKKVWVSVEYIQYARGKKKKVPFLTSRQMLDNHVFTAKQFQLC